MNPGREPGAVDSHRSFPSGRGLPVPLQVGERTAEKFRIVVERAEGAVAVEAEYPPESFGLVIVINVYGGAGLADCALSALL